MSPPTRRRHHLRRFGQWVNLLAFLVGIVVICAAWAFIAHQPRYRTAVDATKTRAYSLSPQSESLLRVLPGEWTISIVLNENDVDRAVLRQIEEVLARYEQANPRITVERIDPGSPHSIVQYEALIQRLRDLFADEVEQYERALTRAREAYTGFIPYAENESEMLRGFADEIGSESGFGEELMRWSGGLALHAQSGPEILARVDGALATDEGRPIPDYEAARDVLYAATAAASSDLEGLGQLYLARAAGPGLGVPLRDHLQTMSATHRGLAVSLQAAADSLRAMPPLDLTKVSSELAVGEAAVIAGNGRAAVIPAWQLIPKSNLRATNEGGIAFDQRFRGEQLLSSTIRSLIVEHMPLVVFVHSSAESLLQETRERKDLFGAATILDASRYEVREWRLEELEPPLGATSQRIVWVIVPPGPGQSGESPGPSEEEQVLIERAQRLIDAGESILISYYPSVMHNLRQPDPWQGLLSGFGVKPDTSRVAFHSQITSEGERVVLPLADVLDIEEDHAIARAVDGQLLRLPWPVPMQINEDGDAQRWVIASLEAGPNRWLEESWINAIASPQGMAELEDRSLDVDASLVVAAERRHPLDGTGAQRVIAVGSGTWMHSALADMVQQLGGERVALPFPGNHELLQASVAWLAGMNDLIAQSPTAQQVSRFDGLTDTSRWIGQWIALAGLPGAALILGIVVWIVRRV